MVKKCALLFSFYGCIFFAMDIKENPISVRQPKATKSLFNCESYCDRPVSWTSVMPKTIRITSDEKSIVMARKGEVLLFTFLDPATRLQITEPTSIITHSRSHQVPKMVVAEAEDKSLVVASAVNYKKPDVDNCLSEYTRYYKGSYKIEKLKWLIYSIALDKAGNFFAIAGKNRIELIDFEKNRQCRIVIPDLKENSFFVDIAINMTTKMNSPIIGVDNNGTIRAMGLNQEGDDFNLFRFAPYKTEDVIKKLLYEDSESLLYVTDEDEIKKMDSYAVLGSEKGQIISIATCPPLCNLGVFYTGDCLTTAYWNSNKKEKLNVRECITVHRKGPEAQTDNILKTAFRKEQFKCKTKDGTFKTCNNYISLVALSPHCAVALTKDGVLSRWDLQEQNESNENTRQLRRRSSSYSGEDLAWLKKEQKHVEKMAQHVEESATESSFAGDAVVRTNSVPTKRKSNSLPESTKKVQRPRSVSTAPAASGSKHALSPRDSDQKIQKTSPRVEVLKKSSGSAKSPRSRSSSRSSSTSPRSQNNSIDGKKDKIQDS